MPGRQFSSNSYRYGINGQEKDDEITGNHGTHTSAEYWEYDTRLGRRWNIDPVFKPWESSYMTFGNNPILNVDPKGNDWFVNKENGNVVFVKGQSQVPEQYGSNDKWENLGKDNMFDKNGKNPTKGKSEIYMDTKIAQSFMKEQGYEKGVRTVIKRITYTGIQAEPGGIVIKTPSVDEQPITTPEITYVKPEKFKEEAVLENGKTKVNFPGVLTSKTDIVTIVKPVTSENELHESSNASENLLKQIGEYVGEAISNFFKKK